MNKSESISEIAKALCAAQGEITNATKSSENPFFRSKYADLSEVLNCIKPVIVKHGLSFTQMPGYIDGIVSVETMVLHTSGEWISSKCESPAPKLDPQGIGSAITYLRRYSLSAVFGLTQADDDGNSQQRQPQQQPRQNQQQPPPQQQQPQPVSNPGPPLSEIDGLKPVYPAEQFKNNLGNWQQLVASGKKKPAAIVTNIQTKFTLTEQQKQTILGIF